MAITGINNSSCTSYYASGYKNTVKKAVCDIQKTKENSQVSKIEESQEDRRTIFAIGTDMKSITENVVAQAVGTAPSIGGSCDIKA